MGADARRRTTSVPPLATLPVEIAIRVGPPLAAGGGPLCLDPTLPSEAVTPVRKSSTALVLGDVEPHARQAPRRMAMEKCRENRFLMTEKIPPGSLRFNKKGDG